MAAPAFINELTAAGSLSAGAALVVFQDGDTFRTTPQALITEAASFTPSGSGATARTTASKLQEIISLTDFMTAAQRSDFTARTKTLDHAAAWVLTLAACNTYSAALHLPNGLTGIGSEVPITTQGQRIYGQGYTNKSVIERFTDSTFDIFDIQTGAEGFIAQGFKIQEPSSSWTNTGSFFNQAANDATYEMVWCLQGWKHIRQQAGSSNIHHLGCLFETARKGAIHSSSSGLNKTIGCTFWKNSADFSNPSDRGYAVFLERESGYDFGSHNWSFVGNYFVENVYGPFMLIDDSHDISITGNFFVVASQVDSGQKSDIEIKNESTRVVIVGNVSNKTINSYEPGPPTVRGSKYVVDIESDCSVIVIGPNAFEAGVSGIINDPGDVATVYGVPGYRDATALVLPVQINGSGTGITMSAQTGTYNRAGRLVTFRATTTLTSKGVGTGAVRLGPLPFTPASIHFGFGFITNSSGITTPIYFQINSDGYVYPLYAVSTNVLDSNIADNSEFQFSGSYQV